jgi:hypothetical protein
MAAVLMTAMVLTLSVIRIILSMTGAFFRGWRIVMTNCLAYTTELTLAEQAARQTETENQNKCG